MTQNHALPSAPIFNIDAWAALEDRFFDETRVAASRARNAGRLRAMCFTHAEPTITLDTVEPSNKGALLESMKGLHDRG